MSTVIPKGVRFAQIPNDLILDRRVSHIAKCVYMYLMFRANSEARCWPAMRTIAEELGMSTSSVSKAVKQLQDIGWLQIRQGKREPGDEHLPANTYMIVGSLDEQQLELVASDEQASVATRTDLVAPDATEQHPLLTTPTEQQRRDLLWESFVAVHGEPTEPERGKYNRQVKLLRDADVTPDEYPTLVAAWVSKHGLQPGVATVANRIGELRHYAAMGPLVAPSADELAEAREWAQVIEEHEREALP